MPLAAKIGGRFKYNIKAWQFTSHITAIYGNLLYIIVGIIQILLNTL